MSYYDWEKIVKNYSDSELSRVFNEKSKEPQEKVDAVAAELVNRGILSSDESEIVNQNLGAIIIDIENVAGKTEANKKFSNFAIIGILLVIIVYVGSIVSSIFQFELLTGIKNSVLVTNGSLDLNSNRQLIILILQITTFIISSISFIIWFYTAYSNLSYRISNINYSVGWSIGAWFVPILSLFRPVNIMSELNNKTNMILESRNIKDKQTKHPFIVWWWGLFIGIPFISRMYNSFSQGKVDVESYLIDTVFSIVISILIITLGVVTIFMIKNYATKEEVLYKSEIDYLAIKQ